MCSILVMALACACAWVPAQAGAVAGPASDGVLSPRLAELAQPSLRTAPPDVQAKELGLASEGPGSLLRKGNRVLVEVRFDHGAAAGVDDLRAAGAKVVNVSRDYQTVTVAVKPGELRQLSGVPRASAATAVLAPVVYGTGGYGTGGYGTGGYGTGGSGPVSAVTTPCFGAATSEGDAQLRANLARSEFEVDGSGVGVGILSDSFDQDLFAETHEREDVESGDLPGTGNPCGRTAPVDILDDSEAEGGDEGRAMAQIIHDLAPGAHLSFATAFTGLTAFAENVEALAAAGANVIADDIFYFEEPFFQEGPVDVAVAKVAEDGVSYFSAAGNDNLINGGEDIASWEAPQFRDSGGCPAAVVALSEEFEEFGEPGLNPSRCMDFDPGPGIDETFRITVSPGATLILDLQWAEPWEGVNSDLDTFLLGPEGAVVTGSIEDNVLGSKRPVEIVGWENETGTPADVQLIINRYSGVGTQPLKFALLENGSGVTSTEYQSSAGGDVVGPTIFGHSGAEDAISVGAIRFDATAAPEVFSSRGPVTHYFEPVNGTAIPAAPLGSPQVVPKPDVVATDGGANTFFGSCVSNTWRFFGTSAAAPHAAAVAALERQAAPGATAVEVAEEVKQAQLETAGPVGAFPPGPAIGAGLVNAAAAVAKLKSEPFSEPIIKITGPGPQNCDLPKPPSPGEKISTANPPAAVLPPFVPNFDASPSTFFRKHPPHVIRIRHLEAKAVFRFGSNESGVTFFCRVDGAPFRICQSRFVRRFGVGPHVLRAMARDAAGNVDSTPAVYRFRVERVGHGRVTRRGRANRRRHLRHDRS